MLHTQTSNELVEALDDALHSSNTESSTLWVLVQLLTLRLHCRQRLRLVVFVGHEVLHKCSEGNQVASLCVNADSAPLDKRVALIAHKAETHTYLVFVWPHKGPS